MPNSIEESGDQITNGKPLLNSIGPFGSIIVGIVMLVLGVMLKKKAELK